MEKALWYPYKDEKGEEQTHGVLISYGNFHKAVLSDLNIVVENNGEVTLIDSDECDHQKITDCYLYLNNWNDRSTTNVKSIWRNVIFSENVMDLQGPVKCAVGMKIVIDKYQDEYENVVFSHNRIYHTYRDRKLKPGNGAQDYVCSSSFEFRIIPNTDGLSAEKNTTGVQPGDKNNRVRKDTPLQYIKEPGLISYYGNSIIYSQHSEDKLIDNLEWAFEHSCFKIYGGRVDIHDNFIDGTKAFVERREASSGVYGKTENPVSLLHCLPCDVDGDYSVRFYNNQAYGYGVVLRCKEQFFYIISQKEKVNCSYSVSVEGNSLFDGAAVVLYHVVDSKITIIQNRFFNCTADFLQGANLQRINITICQNFFDSDSTMTDYQGYLFEPGKFTGSYVEQLYVMSNCFIGYNNFITEICDDSKPKECSAIGIGILCNSNNQIASKVVGNISIDPIEPEKPLQ